jgi:hypothetical protein
MWVRGGETIVGARERETRRFRFSIKAKASVGVKFDKA